MIDNLGGEDDYKVAVKVTGGAVEIVEKEEKKVPSGKKAAFGRYVGLGKLKDLVKGTRVVVKGIVATEPGLMRQNYFHIIFL